MKIYMVSLFHRATINNDIHISRAIPHPLLWLTRTCPILLKSTVFVHQIHLAAYGLPDTGCNHSAKSVFPEVAQNSLRIPWVYHVQRNPSVFQVFQVCDHHDKGSHAPSLGSPAVNQERMRLVGDFLWLCSLLWVSFCALMLLVGWRERYLLLQWRAHDGVLPHRWYISREQNRWPSSRLSWYQC